MSLFLRLIIITEIIIKLSNIAALSGQEFRIQENVD